MTSEVRPADPPLQEPKELTVRDWQERLRVAKEAFDLGRKTMVPEPTLPLPMSLSRPAQPRTRPSSGPRTKAGTSAGS